jgi:hypothetical protein
MATIVPILVNLAIQAAIAIAATLIINAIFPVKIEGPRLTDLRVQVSTYGRAIAMLFGPEIRVAGNVIDSTGLTEHAKEESAKGGPTITTYSYTTDVDILLGAGRPNARLKKVWGNGKLIYDADLLESMALGDCPETHTVRQCAAINILLSLKGGLDAAVIGNLRFYPGTFEQEPDPFFESVRGVGEVPAYLGTMHVVIQSLLLTDFGNVLPNLEFLVEADPCETYKTATEAIVEAAGIPANLYNFDCLSRLSLRGYAIGRVMTAAQALAPLTFAGNFDIVDDGGYLRSVFRDDEVVGIISTDDLGGHAFGDDRPDPISFDRAPTIALPKEATVVFMDPARDYQENAQSARRLTGSADSNVTFELALSLTVDEARALADRALWESWMITQTAKAPATERLIDIKVGRVYLFETPAGYEPFRTLARTIGANGVIELELKRERSEIYSSIQTGAAAPSPDNEMEIPGLTELILLDIPLMRDADDNPGFYYGVVGSESGWRGAAILRAISTAHDYTIINTMGVQSAAGDCLNTLLAGETGIDSDGSGGSFDDVNYLDVELRHEGLTLESADDEAIEAGANAAYIGPPDPTVDGEIIQFGIATFLTGTTYRLTHLKRGLRGTEYAVGLHGADELFVQLTTSATARSNFGTPDLNLERAYKGVSVLHASDMYDPILFTNTGVGLRPYSPIDLSIAGDTGGDLILEWIRRSRLDSGVLGEATELYTVRIMNSLGTVIEREAQATEQSFRYTVPMQVEDFGAAVSDLRWRVAQVSAIYGNGIFSEFSGAVPSTGSSGDPTPDVPDGTLEEVDV